MVFGPLRLVLVLLPWVVVVSPVRGGLAPRTADPSGFGPELGANPDLRIGSRGFVGFPEGKIKKWFYAEN